MVCKYCGTNNPRDSKFCNECGRKVGRKHKTGTNLTVILLIVIAILLGIIFSKTLFEDSNSNNKHGEDDQLVGAENNDRLNIIKNNKKNEVYEDENIFKYKGYNFIVEGSNYSSPEECIYEYYGALLDGNIDKMWSMISEGEIELRYKASKDFSNEMGVEMTDYNKWFNDTKERFYSHYSSIYEDQVKKLGIKRELYDIYIYDEKKLDFTNENVTNKFLDEGTGISLKKWLDTGLIDGCDKVYVFEDCFIGNKDNSMDSYYCVSSCMWVVENNGKYSIFGDIATGGGTAEYFSQNPNYYEYIIGRGKSINRDISEEHSYGEYDGIVIKKVTYVEGDPHVYYYLQLIGKTEINCYANGRFLIVYLDELLLEDKFDIDYSRYEGQSVTVKGSYMDYLFIVDSIQEK